MIANISCSEDAEILLEGVGMTIPKTAEATVLCEKCGIDKSKALMIGDRDIDINVGHNAGMEACLFDSDDFYSDVEAEYCIKNLLELKHII